VHIRAIIKADCVVLFDSLGSTDSYHQTASAYHAQLLPYEFRALEAALVSVISSLQSELDVLSNLVTNLLAHIEVSIDRDKLKELLQYSKRLSKFEQKTLSIRDAINDVLDQDEDLAGMYLTAKELGISRSIDDHEEVELLLETYLKQVEEIANSTSTLIQNMRSTEDIVNIILDSQRNSLLLLELRVAITTMGMSCGALIASMFGMNLESGLEHHPQAFYIVAGTMMAMVSTAALLVMRKMRMIKKF
ncbi:Mg2+ transporter protein, partial [Ramicandelaber brevisporus]